VKEQVRTNFKVPSCKDATMGLTVVGSLLFISSPGFRKALSCIPGGRGGQKKSSWQLHPIQTFNSSLLEAGSLLTMLLLAALPQEVSISKGLRLGDGT